MSTTPSAAAAASSSTTSTSATASGSRAGRASPNGTADPLALTALTRQRSRNRDQSLLDPPLVVRAPVRRSARAELLEWWFAFLELVLPALTFMVVFPAQIVIKLVQGLLLLWREFILSHFRHSG